MSAERPAATSSWDGNVDDAVSPAGRATTPSPSPDSLAATTPRLTEPQRRHLVELYGEGDKTLYWHVTHGSPEHRCAEALRVKGLVTIEGSIIGREGGGYRLTREGCVVAEALIGF